MQNRPAQRLFNKGDILDVNLEQSTIGGDRFWIFHKKKYKDGLLYKEVNVKTLVLENIHATHEEVRMFAAVKDTDGNDI